MVCITKETEKHELHQCSGCGLDLPQSAFSDSQWKHRRDQTQEGGKCMVCLEEEGKKQDFHECSVCGTPLPETAFTVSQWQHKLKRGATCTACFFPNCTVENCQLCKRCHDPACTQPNKCKRALLQPPVELRPKTKDERDTFKCVLCLYTKCTGCGKLANKNIKKRLLETRTTYKCVACSQRALTQKDKALCANPK